MRGSGRWPATNVRTLETWPMVSRDEAAENAWMRSHGRCECERSSHGHTGRCGWALVWEQRGQKLHPAGWEAHRNGRKGCVGWGELNQCEVLCWACYVQTRKLTAFPKMTRVGRHLVKRN